MSAEPMSALFVRLPQAQARALDRLAFESRRPKQAVVSELLSRSIGEPAARRLTIETREDREPPVGHYAFRPDEADLLARERGVRSSEPDVLTLEEVADLLRVDLRQVQQLARDGRLPGRQIGAAWRFSRAAVLEWLGRRPPAEHGEG